MMLRSSDFAGRWTLARIISDHLQGQEGVLTGEATFTKAATYQLIYRETGTLRFEAGPQMEATRSYHWQFADERVDVSFADGRPFHRFVPEGHADGTRHPCGDDLYLVRYDFSNWPRWRAVWTVKGPRKDYVSVSDYAPSPA